ncbi:hypothetical protein B0H14DRAFT_2618593, partial [Mycena olivaceomarginata]
MNADHCSSNNRTSSSPSAAQAAACPFICPRPRLATWRFNSSHRACHRALVAPAPNVLPLATPNQVPWPNPGRVPERKRPAQLLRWRTTPFQNAWSPGETCFLPSPGALTWLHFDNHECRQLCRLFDATEGRANGGPRNHVYCPRGPPRTSAIFAIAFQTPPQNWKCSCGRSSLLQLLSPNASQAAFSIDPSVESTEDNPYPIDEFYCTPLLWVRPTGERRDLVTRRRRTGRWGMRRMRRGDESGSESGAFRPGSSTRPSRKTQPASSSTTNAEGSSKSASASTSKPGGTIHVKKEGAAILKTPATPTAQNRPTPKAAYRGAPSSTVAPPSPEAKHL